MRKTGLSVEDEKRRYEPIPVDLLYTVPEVAEMLKVTPNVVRRLIKMGEIKALKIGSLKIRGTEVNRFLDDAEGKDLSSAAVMGE